MLAELSYSNYLHNMNTLVAFASASACAKRAEIVSPGGYSSETRDCVEHAHVLRQIKLNDYCAHYVFTGGLDMCACVCVCAAAHNHYMRAHAFWPMVPTSMPPPR